MERTVQVIARIRSDFPTKFGVPRQAGLVPALRAEVVFEPPYRNDDALRGIEGFSHLWLIWEFSEAVRKDWSPTVRPPRLGGNERVGVFASRSPFRPNPIGLSCVRLEAVHTAPQPVTLTVSGIDLLDGTPIYDIKPYLPYADAYPDAAEGYTAQTRQHCLRVDFPPALLEKLPETHRSAAAAMLSGDPRPGYLDSPERVYGVLFAGFDIRFQVAGDLLTVIAVEATE